MRTSFSSSAVRRRRWKDYSGFFFSFAPIKFEHIPLNDSSVSSLYRLYDLVIIESTFRYVRSRFICIVDLIYERRHTSINLDCFEIFTIFIKNRIKFLASSLVSLVVGTIFFSASLSQRDDAFFYRVLRDATQPRASNYIHLKDQHSPRQAALINLCARNRRGDTCARKKSVLRSVVAPGSREIVKMTLRAVKAMDLGTEESVPSTVKFAILLR